MYFLKIQFTKQYPYIISIHTRKIYYENQGSLGGWELEPVWFRPYVERLCRVCRGCLCGPAQDKENFKTCVVVCLQDDDLEDMVDLVHAAHSNLAKFHSQCAQKLFRKPKRILAAMKGVVESFGRAKLRALAKQWVKRLEEFSVVKKTSKKLDALAYAYFNYAGGTCQEVAKRS